MPGDRLSPSGARRRLRTALRESREVASMTQREVAERLQWSLSKLMRMESGAVSIAPRDVQLLCGLYELGAAVTERLAGHATAGQEKSWWFEYREHLTQSSAALIDLESDAVRIRQFATLTVPGQLQTARYAEAVLRFAGELVTGAADEQRIATGVVVRQRRRSTYEGPDAPELSVVLDEAVLYRLTGSAAVMAEQLLLVAEFARRPRIDIRVLPLEAGVHLANGDFVLADLDDGTAALYLEALTEDTAVESPSQVAAYSRAFDALRRRALDPTRTNHLLHRVAAQYAAGEHVRPWL
ncbi:helix-turn-helix transcriptional regulator [Dactylosporangium sp. AC04546]|uniref:helix-turn-helix domain-containing protein n=1 Tax=Dactylosporangium sp. AC04546 TaxID=2862460 RepID=UPI001EDDAB3D|nr:helix-turn-helix transcriptional regulator [Dactylosporangium sp. AC04546]WVK80112.1 helix-turn-helix transcriptional regulator [Dactylosporangium sp. AC04546]